MLGLLGPNGSGKTTLLSLLVLALEPTSGRRLYGGLDAARAGHRPAIRRMLGYLPQDFAPVGHLSGFEYLVHCARLRGVPLSERDLARLARQLLDAVGLSEAADRRSSEYSGGMRRRLGFAQALVHAPRILVVDEPTAGLDPEERLRLRNLITDVAEETALLLSTHIVEDIEATCSRIVVIGKGKILHDGSPTDLLEMSAGRLWDVPAASVLPDGSAVVSRRAGPSGEPILVVHSESRPADAAPRTPLLEEAYGAFLARHGLLDPPEANGVAA